MESPFVSHIRIPVPPILYIVGWIVIDANNQKCFPGIRFLLPTPTHLFFFPSKTVVFCRTAGSFESFQFLLVWASPLAKLMVFVHSPSVLDYFLARKAVFILSWDMLLSHLFSIDPSSTSLPSELHHICLPVSSTATLLKILNISWNLFFPQLFGVWAKCRVVQWHLVTRYFVVTIW